MEISLSTDINSTAETVFGWIGSPQKAVQWMTSVSNTGEILHEVPGMVGTTFRETVTDGNKGLEMQGIVTGYTPNQSISFHLSSKIHTVDVEFLIEETSVGVRLTQNAKVHWKFPMNIISYLMGSKIKQGIIDQTQTELKRLKELCEGEHGGSSDKIKETA
jgi:uncharacterized protein YndB with AHSA1/START domain